MDINELLIGRLVERILVVLFGGLSLVLGWRLFIVGVVDPQIAEVKFKDWKVSLRQVGPGSVFAALGIAVMGFALFRPLEVSEGLRAGSLPTAASAASTRTLSYMGTPEDLKHWVRVLNTFARTRYRSIAAGHRDGACDEDRPCACAEGGGGNAQYSTPGEILTDRYRSVGEVSGRLPAKPPFRAGRRSADIIGARAMDDCNSHR